MRGMVKMRETFYVYMSGERQYQLRVKESHEVVATSSSEEGILDSLDVIVRRYKTSTRFFKKLAKTEIKISTALRDKRKEEYESIDNSEMGKEIDRVVLDALKEVKEDSKIKLIGKDTIKIKPREVEEEEEKPKQKVVKLKKKIGLITI